MFFYLGCLVCPQWKRKCLAWKRLEVLEWGYTQREPHMLREQGEEVRIVEGVTGMGAMIRM